MINIGVDGDQECINKIIETILQKLEDMQLVGSAYCNKTS